MPDENTASLDKDSLYVVTSSTRIQILKLLIEKKQLTATDISKELNLSKSTVHEHIEKLAAAGLITKSEYSGKKWVYYKPTWRGRDMFPQKDRMQINVVLAVVFMVGASIVLSAMLYVWSAGLASTGGSAPPAFSASVADAADTITDIATTPQKNLGKLTGSTFTQGVTVAPRAESAGVAFLVTYSGTALPGYVYVNVTYVNEKGESKTAGPIKFAPDQTSATNYAANLSGSDIGVKKVTAITATDDITAAYTPGLADTFYVNITAYDTICKITADNGKPGDITKLVFYIKIGATGDWKKLTPDTANPYKIGAVVLDGDSTDLSWDVGESVYISETSTLGDIAPDTTNPVYVKVIHEPSSSTIYESKIGVNIL